MNGKEALNFV